MNKLVIIGNGFDLAHGLPTSYRDFMDDFWSSLNNRIDSPEIEKIITYNQKYLSEFDLSQIQNFEDFKEKMKAYCSKRRYGFNEDSFHSSIKGNVPYTVIFDFKNDFFKKINIKSIDNWVDIESEYYNSLKVILYSSSLDYNAKNKQVLILNQELEHIKLLLQEYLCEQVEETFNFKKPPINYGILTQLFEVKPKNVSTNTFRNSYLNEFPKEDHDHLIKVDEKLIQAKNNGRFEDLLRSGQATYSSIFLNFNYTRTINSYIEILKDMYYDKINQISIHGNLNNALNDINFGYGDEMDKDYKMIEDLNQNEYLKNFKSFKYSQNSNYKNLLDYIESDKFQVYIMGHSCGLSDRTLLNTIFEHENCRSIKVFYHLRGDGSDNYKEIIQNISRHFNDKKMMRARVVNKSLCQPLPQNIRFQEKDTF